MTRVDFYILPETEPEHRYRFACRLAEKAFKLGHGIYIHSEDDTQARLMDDMLWQFRDSSFVPHQLIDNIGHAAGDVPVRIGYASSESPEQMDHGLLINLAGQVPEFFSRFRRVSEVVVQQPQVQQATRSHYRFYRDRGYPLQTHDLR